MPEDKIPWSTDYPDYQPVDYTAPKVLAGPVWADPDIKSVPISLLPYQDTSVPNITLLHINLLCAVKFHTYLETKRFSSTTPLMAKWIGQVTLVPMR